jgi:hypothetical protein
MTKNSDFLKDQNLAAFPCDEHQWGLTKREYFAILIMQSKVASNPSAKAKEMAFDAIYLADELLEALTK